MVEIIIAVASFIGGWLAGKFLDFSFDTVVNSISLRIKRRSVKKLSTVKTNDIRLLCSGVPDFAPENIDIEINKGANLFLAFPDDLRNQLPKSAGTFRSNDELFTELIVPGFSSEQVGVALETARRKIAEMFVARTDGLFFNGSKYGVEYADGFSRTADSSEDPILTLKLFNTDHYTHRVIEEAVSSLALNADQVSNRELNSSLNWIRTSLGLSVIVILKSTNQIIMTRRSANSSFSEGKTWIYVSATETFTQTDYDPYTHSADLTLCLKRGILEELGITQNMYYDSTIKFYDMFFETHFYQDGIVATVELKENTTFEEVRNLSAKDKQLEVDDMFVIDNTRKSIIDFINSHQGEMRSQTVFALRCHAARLRK